MCRVMNHVDEEKSIQKTQISHIDDGNVNDSSGGSDSDDSVPDTHTRTSNIYKDRPGKEIIKNGCEIKKKEDGKRETKFYNNY